MQSQFFANFTGNYFAFFKANTFKISLLKRFFSDILQKLPLFCFHINKKTGKNFQLVYIKWYAQMKYFCKMRRAG